MAGEKYGFVPYLIALVVALVLKQVYDVYKAFVRKPNHEAFFVMMGEQECCSITDMSSSRQCKKYCMGKLMQRIMGHIKFARSSLCIAMYNFTNHKMTDCILGAFRRGVKVRLIVDQSIRENPESMKQIKRLKDAGAVHFVH